MYTPVCGCQGACADRRGGSCSELAAVRGPASAAEPWLGLQPDRRNAFDMASAYERTEFRHARLVAAAAQAPGLPELSKHALRQGKLAAAAWQGNYSVQWSAAWPACAEQASRTQRSCGDRMAAARPVVRHRAPAQLAAAEAAQALGIPPGGLAATAARPDARQKQPFTCMAFGTQVLREAHLPEQPTFLVAWPTEGAAAKQGQIVVDSAEAPVRARQAAEALHHPGDPRSCAAWIWAPDVSCAKDVQQQQAHQWVDTSSCESRVGSTALSLVSTCKH